MGLAASQARYLTLTSRKSDLEYQSQTINSRRIQLSYRTAEIARAYSEGMNNKVIKMCTVQLDTDGTSTKTWKELTFQNLLATGDYMIIGTAGTPLDPSPYEWENTETEVYCPANTETDRSLSADEYKLIKGQPNADAYVSTITKKKDEDGNETDEDEVRYTLKASSSKDVYDKLTNPVKGYFSSSPTKKNTINWKINDQYSSSKNAMDLQSLLVSGKAQIVSRDFFNYMVTHGGYSYDAGLTKGNMTYKSLMDAWNANSDGINEGHKPSVIDWRSDESSTFAQKTYTEDDADVLAAYEAATAEVQAQDKMLEMEEKNIETQHKAIETELENIKKVIQKNIDDTFKIFS